MSKPLASAGMTSREYVTALPFDPPLAPVAAPAPDWPDRALDLAASHPSVVGGVLVAAVLAVALLISWRRGKVESWIVAVSWIAAFGFSAEGMWYVATDKANVPPVVAAGVFFVFELFQIRSMLAARRRYRATTVRDQSGRVTKAGDPGKHGVAVWGLAAVMGAIVALAAHNPADALLRLSIPLGAAWLWWNDLTDEGVQRERGSWRWTPRRIGLALRLLEPAERDMATVHREARIKQLTELEHARLNGSWGWLRARLASRLARLSLSADRAMIAQVREQVALARWFEEPYPAAGPVGDTGDTRAETPQSYPGTDPGDVPGIDPGGNVGIGPGDTPGVEAGTGAGVDVGAEPSAARVPTRVRPPSPKQVRALKLRAQPPDMTAAEIARKVPADYKTVRTWLKNADAASPDLPVAPPAEPVMAGTNGHAFYPSTTPKETPS